MVRKVAGRLITDALPEPGKLDEKVALELLTSFGEYLSEEVQTLLASIIGLELSRIELPGRYRVISDDVYRLDDDEDAGYVIIDDAGQEERFEVVEDFAHRRATYVVDEADAVRVAAKNGVKPPSEWDDCGVVVRRLSTWRLVESELAEAVARGVYTAMEYLSRVRRLVKAYARAAKRCSEGKN